MILEPWYWFVLGIALMLLELVFTTFAAFWFGIAALMVSLIYWLCPWMSTTVQLVLWAVFSIVCTLLWFKYIKPLAPRPKPEHIIGQTGMVIEQYPHQVKVRFTTPILGKEEWFCKIQAPLAVGERIQITHFSEDQIFIKPYKG